MDIGQWASQAVVIAAGIFVFLQIIDKVLSFKDRSSRPEIEQNKRLFALEAQMNGVLQKMQKHDEYFDNDKRRIDDMEKEAKQVNTIVIKSLQALTDHALNGSNDDQLIACSKEMNEYLVNR